MRLKISRAQATELLTALAIRGHEILRGVDAYLVSDGLAIVERQDLHTVRQDEATWEEECSGTLLDIFPTRLEADQYLQHQGSHLHREASVEWNWLHNSLLDRLDALKEIVDVQLGRYTDLPTKERLFVQDIDSFIKVRDVNHTLVDGEMKGARLEWSEDRIQHALEKILGESFHKMDHGGEENDLYTSNLRVGGVRMGSAFLRKGPGVGVVNLEIKHCGSTGDQIVKLFQSPATLFVLQFVGRVSESVIKEMAVQVRAIRAQGREAFYCIMQGLDTAMVLKAYGLLNNP